MIHGRSAAALALLMASCAPGNESEVPKRATSPGIANNLWESNYHDLETRLLLESHGKRLGGEPYGPWTWFHPNQQMKTQGQFNEQGERTAEWIDFHPRGSRAMRVRYNAGLRQGRVEHWHTNGALAERGTFVDDRLQGCLLYTSPSPRDRQKSRMPSSA